MTKKVIKNRLLPVPDKGDISSLRIMVAELSRAFAEYGQRLNDMAPRDGSEGILAFDPAQTFDGRDLSADGAKLDGIESGATADQTGAEIKTAYEGEVNTNAFTDAEQSKLSAIQTVSTQTGAVSTGTTVMPLDDTIPQNTEGDQYMTLAITPTNTSNILEIDVVVNASHSSATNGNLSAALFQDSTAGALATGFHGRAGTSGDSPQQINIKHSMAAGTTSSTTFKVRAGGGAAGTTTFNGVSSGRIFGGVMASSITIREYKP